MSPFKCEMFKNVHGNWAWLYMPLVPAFSRQRRADLCEFKASLVYKASSSTAKAVTQRNPISKNQGKGGVEWRGGEGVLMCMALSSQVCEHQNPPAPYSFYRVFFKTIRRLEEL